MYRLTFILVPVLALLTGCTQDKTAKSDDTPRPIAQVGQKDNPGGQQPGGDRPGGDKPVIGDPKVDPPGGEPEKPAPAGDDKQERYEAALNDALTLLVDRKFTEALAALELARAVDDNDFIRGEIAKVQQRLDQDSAAKSTVQNIETVLGEGKAADAVQLTTQALKEFGGSADSPALVKLRLQADALASVQKNEDAAARAKRFREEGEAALAEKNLRAAALALEQAIAAQADAALQDRLDAIQADLQKYDNLRARAATLRRDPAQLEDAIAALKDAQAAWDTLQVRQDLDEYTLALQKRREALSVGTFEVRGNVGAADLGLSLADELLPQFRSRFNLVERGQLNQVMAELKLEQGFPSDPAQQRELSRLAKVRYLVVGSIYPLGGITVQARLIDVQTGLVVQTGKVVAPSVEDAVALAPELARQLMMTDEQKMAYDESLQQKVAKAPPLIPVDAPLPPPPPPPPADAPPPAPQLMADAIPVVPPAPVGGLRIEMFRALPPPPAPGVVMLPPVDAPGDNPFKKRLLIAALGRGDGLFLAGNFAEAHRHFELALNLAPGHVDIALRIDRCRPLLPPPPPPVVVIVTPPPMVRPRIAILNFITAGDPRVVPPALGAWTPQCLAPYVADRYDVVDQSLVYWYMGSMGMTVNDLMTDPGARRWLGRALGVRYFLLGTLEQTASFDVSTYLIDAEFGYLQGSARLHVNNPFELKLRMGELAFLTLMDPVERQQYLAQAAFDGLVQKGRAAMGRQDFLVAVQLFDDALRLRPLAVDVRLYRLQAHRAAEAQALERQRQQYFAAQAAAIAATQRRQVELVVACDHARLAAQQHTATLAVDQRAALQAQRVQAQTVLIKQAQVSFQTKRFGLSVSIYESAVAIAPPPANDSWRDLAQARMESARQTQLAQAQLGARQEAAAQKQREEQLVTARLALEEQQKQLEAKRLAQSQKDKLTYNKAIAEGQSLLAKDNLDGARSAFLVARQLQHTETVDKLLELTAQRRIVAQGKTEAERKELEAQLDAERTRRIAAEAEAKRNQERYLDALKLAQAALQQKDYPTAQAKFTEASTVYKTDVVLTGLKQVAQARAADTAVTRAKQLEDEKAARVKQLLTDGQAALKEKKYPAAVQTFQQARKLAPNHLDVLAGLTEAQHGQDQQLAQERKQADETSRLVSFQKLLKSGQANHAAKQYDAAVANLTEALKLNPADATATAALKQAEQARTAQAPDAKAQAEAKQKLATYQKHFAAGRSALTAKQYDAAIKEFSEAQKLLPGDQASKDYLADAQKGKQGAAEAIALAAQKQAEAQKRKATFEAAMLGGQKAHAAKSYGEAIKAYSEAARLMPDDTRAPALLKQAQQAQADAAKQAEVEAARQKVEQQRRAQFADLLKDAAAKAAAKRFAEAKGIYQDALRLYPSDTGALAGLRQVNLALDEPKTKTPPTKDTPAKDVAAKDTPAKDVAAKDLKTPPKDTPAKDLKTPPAKDVAVKDLKTPPAKDTLPKDTKPPAKDGKVPPVKDVKALYQKAMQDAAALEKQQKYADAVRTYEEALQLVPRDLQATAAMRRAQLSLHTTEGQRYLDLGRFVDAQREFEAALKLAPNDPALKKLLEKAKQMKK